MGGGRRKMSAQPRRTWLMRKIPVTKAGGGGVKARPMQADLRVPLILSVGKGSNFRFDHFREEVIKQPEAKFPVTDFRREICYRGGGQISV